MTENALPILFTFRRTLFGEGFVVEVKASNGRALCVQEDDGVWMYGVNPGGMAARGADQAEARDEFAHAFTRILKNIVEESTSFDSFKSLVKAFFEGTNAGFEPDWFQAVQATKEAGVSVEGLPKLPADMPRAISVELKQAYKSTDNESELASALAIAA